MARTSPSSTGSTLLDDFSLEMTGKDVRRLEQAHRGIPPGTRINVTFLGNEDHPARLTAAHAVRRLGFEPVPHIAARRLRSPAELDEFLAALRAERLAENVFVVGGDPGRPHGPFPDAAAVIRSGLLERHGVREVGIGGYPEGHPAISTHALWSAVADKARLLAERGFTGGVTTQFGFDAAHVLTWVEQLRARGVDLPVRIGVPGPAGAKRLLGYAARFGVGTSAAVVRKYGFSMANLLNPTGPDRLLAALADSRRPQRHGGIKLHFYPFGGIQDFTDWLTALQQREGS